MSSEDSRKSTNRVNRRAGGGDELGQKNVLVEFSNRFLSIDITVSDESGNIG